MIGIDALVDLTMKNDAVSKWHLNGYMKKCSAPVRKYLAVCAAAGRPSENMLLELLEDDRFLLHADKLWDVLIAEHNYLMSAPQLLYDSVGALLHIDAEEFKSDVIEASLTSISYLYMECWVPLSQPPLKYTQGDVRANIEDLKKDMSVVDEVSLKMQTLALMGYEDDVIAACHQLKETALSLTAVEQAHASGAQLMRRHPTLESVSLLARMPTHNARTLFYPDEFEKQHLRLTNLLETLDKQIKNANKAGPRQEYVKLLVQEVKRSRELSRPSEHAIRRFIFKHHSELFKQLDGGQVAALRVRARGHVSQRLET